MTEYLAEWPETDKLSLKFLTLRTVVLFTLLSGQRGQTVHKLHVDDVKLSDNKCVIVYSSILKQSKPGVHVQPLVVHAFVNKKLCSVEHLRQYILATKDLRTSQGLFVTFVKPHKHVSRDTISRWIKWVLEMAGIDVSRFSAHSTRSASTSAAFKRNIPVDTIMKAAGWSGKKTFSRFYCKPILEKCEMKSMSQSVLDSFINKS